MKEKDEAEENKSKKMGKKVRRNGGTRKNGTESYSYRRGLHRVPWPPTRLAPRLTSSVGTSPRCGPALWSMTGGRRDRWI